MAELDQHDAQPSPPPPPLTVGERLRAAREAAGLGRADIAARTKIAERHLCAIEENRFDDLASSTYAVGFARAYARTVGLDEAEIARQVRARLDTGDDDVRPAVTFEPGDPARIPTPRLVWLAAAGVLAVIVAVFVFWRSYYAPAVELPDLAAPEATAIASTPASTPATLPAPLPSASASVPVPEPGAAAPAVRQGPAAAARRPAAAIPGARASAAEEGPAPAASAAAPAAAQTSTISQ